jgi:hypothetical protein
VLRSVFESQDAEGSWADEERRALSAHIEEGYLQAERGELIDSAKARSEIQAMKGDWRLPKRCGVNPKTETVESATLCIEGSMEWQTTACDIVRRSGWRR